MKIREIDRGPDGFIERVLEYDSTDGVAIATRFAVLAQTQRDAATDPDERLRWEYAYNVAKGSAITVERTPTDGNNNKNNNATRCLGAAPSPPPRGGGSQIANPTGASPPMPCRLGRAMAPVRSVAPQALGAPYDL